MESTVRIHVLGSLRVQRADGTLVQPREWRTQKTSDLLRMLALAGDEPMRADLVLDRLWPNVPRDRARASLRTAAWTIRHVMQRNCVERTPAGLCLVGVWVDAVECRELAVAARRAVAGRDLDRAVDLALAFEELYRADPHAAEDDAAWIELERLELSQARARILLDGAESAVAAGRYREAVDLAERGVRVDETAERLHRTLMWAHAAMGDIGTALRIYEKHRGALAEELGVDPSRETRELHETLLRMT